MSPHLELYNGELDVWCQGSWGEDELSEECGKTEDEESSEMNPQSFLLKH